MSDRILSSLLALFAFVMFGAIVGKTVFGKTYSATCYENGKVVFSGEYTSIDRINDTWRLRRVEHGYRTSVTTDDITTSLECNILVKPNFGENMPLEEYSQQHWMFDGDLKQ